MASPTVRCSVETNSSSISVASCCAVVMAASDSRDSCGCALAPLICGQPVDKALGLGADSGGLDADSLQQRRGDPVVLRQQR